MTHWRRCGLKMGRTEPRPPLVEVQVARTGVRGRGMRRRAALRDSRNIVVTIIIVAAAGDNRLGELGVRGRRAGVDPVHSDVPEPERPQQAASEVPDILPPSAAGRAAKCTLGKS
jgi:hypothetical protein